MKKFFPFLFTLLAFFSFGQAQNTDSLWNVYNDQARPDTSRLSALTIIAWSLRNNQPDSAISLAEHQLKLAGSLSAAEGKIWIANAFRIIGVSYMNKGNYEKALEYSFNALKLYEELGDKKRIGSCLLNIGLMYQRQSNYSKALDFDLRGLKISQETGNKIAIGNCYNNMGIVYMAQSDFKKALECYFKALKILEELNDIPGIVNCNLNIGLAYHNLKDFSSSLSFYSKGLKLCEEHNEKQGMAYCYLNIGGVYYTQANYPKALDYYVRALAMSKQIGDKYNIANCYTNIAGIHKASADYKSALKYLDSALTISKSTGDITNQQECYKNIADINAKTGNYREAYQNHLRLKKITDSIFNIENSKQLSDLKTNFEVQKKELELKAKADAQQAIADEERKRQTFITYSVVCVLVLVIIFAGFMVNRFTVTSRQKKIIELKEHETQRQNEIITHQKKLVEEKHKEITDSINYAERIQRSFLATAAHLDKNLSSGNGPGYFIFFRPKDIVSGDFYWSATLGNGNFALATADSTGHGVPGAIMSLLNITSLEKAIESQTKPSEILNATRNIIIERLKKDGSADGGKDGMDCSLCVYDFKNKKIQIAAAHNPVWIVRRKGNEREIIEIKPDKMPVGKHDKQNTPFTLHEIDLREGDLIYTLTDGFPDQFGGEKGKKFMIRNLRELLASNAHLPMSSQKELLEKTFDDWKGRLEQVDDVCIIGIKL